MKKAIILIAGLIMFLGACSALRVNDPVAEDIEQVKIYIEAIANNTNKYGLSIELMNALAADIDADGRLLFVNNRDEADEVVRISILSYVLEPLTYDKNMNVEQYKLEVRVSVFLVDAKDNQEIWEDTQMSALQIYRNDPDLAQGLAIENEMRQVAWEKLSRNIVRNIVKAQSQRD
ncbi:MAG: LPS assembly lipoprotein LptE [Elusimicrobiota bacterium]|jgi:hypothetical protein|nr:LPS assembly lipoprotein LptE [Elusimicrobiota bacterium]